MARRCELNYIVRWSLLSESLCRLFGCLKVLGGPEDGQHLKVCQMALRFRRKKELERDRTITKRPKNRGRTDNQSIIIVWNQFKYLIEYSLQVHDSLIIKSMLDTYKLAYSCILSWVTPTCGNTDFLLRCRNIMSSVKKNIDSLLTWATIFQTIKWLPTTGRRGFVYLHKQGYFESEIWGSHGGKNEDGSFLSCSAV
jgi:hypothetical protein